jgi:hypothetical protein
MQIFTNLHDPLKTYFKLIENEAEFFTEHLQNTIVAASENTSIEVIKLLEKLGCKVVEGGDYSFGKRNGLSNALKSDDDTFIYFDLDKLLHWIKDEPSELIDLLRSTAQYEFCFVGRNEETNSTYPNSWIKTEGIINKLLSDELGINCDPTSSNIILKRSAAEIILKNSFETSWNILIEWPLIVRNYNLSVGQITPKGMTWEDPDRFLDEIKDAGSVASWVDKKYDNINEWQKRVSILNDLVSALVNFHN